MYFHEPIKYYDKIKGKLYVIPFERLYETTRNIRLILYASVFRRLKKEQLDELQKAMNYDPNEIFTINRRPTIKLRARNKN